MKKKYKTFDRNRPVSWSFISSFEWSMLLKNEQWYESYVLGIKQTSPQMEFGSYVDKRLQDDLTFLPEVERYPVLQHEMRASLGKIPLVGFADGVDFDTLRLKDDKTGVKAWTQERADETGQLTMYCLLLWLTEKIRPEDMNLFISWLPTKQNGDFTYGFRDKKPKPVIIKTKRTMKQVLEFGQRIQKTLIVAEEYCKQRGLTQV